jgi:hypothetical protein
MGYGSFALWVVHKERLRPSGGDTNRLMMWWWWWWLCMVRVSCPELQNLSSVFIMRRHWHGTVLTFLQGHMLPLSSMLQICWRWTLEDNFISYQCFSASLEGASRFTSSTSLFGRRISRGIQKERALTCLFLPSTSLQLSVGLSDKPQWKVKTISYPRSEISKQCPVLVESQKLFTNETEISMIFLTVLWLEMHPSALRLSGYTYVRLLCKLFPCLSCLTQQLQYPNYSSRHSFMTQPSGTQLDRTGDAFCLASFDSFICIYAVCNKLWMSKLFYWLFFFSI